MQKNGTILSNFDIINLANHLNLPLVGCFSKDKLPKKLIKGLFVVNLADAITGGSHWTAFSTQDKNTWYYDSFGSPPPKEVDQYIQATTGKRNYAINKIQTQALGATYCGWFCIAALYCITHTKARGSVVKRMDAFNDWLNPSDLDKNYDKLLAFFRSVDR